MISVPSLRLNQFGVRFYEALLSGADLQSLVGFEVLSFGPGSETTRGKRQEGAAGRVNWEFLEKRISASEQAFQRPIIKKKIDELVAYYLQCADSGHPSGHPRQRPPRLGEAARVRPVGRPVRRRLAQAARRSPASSGPSTGSTASSPSTSSPRSTACGTSRCRPWSSTT